MSWEDDDFRHCILYTPCKMSQKKSDHDPEPRTDIVEYVSLEYRECAGLLAEASLVGKSTLRKLKNISYKDRNTLAL